MVRFLYFLLASVLFVSVNGAIVETQDISVCEGEDLTLSCNYSGNATNTTWTFGDMGNVSHECNLTCNFTLENITSTDSGFYNCSVDGVIVSEYDVVVMTTPLTYNPVCSVTVNGTSRNRNGVVYVREDDSVTLNCSVQEPGPRSLEWSYWNEDNETSTTIGNVARGTHNNIYLINNDDIEQESRVFTCEAFFNDTCSLTTKNCTLGPVYTITEDNFYIERVNETIYLGDNVTFECVTNVTGTDARWVNGTGSLLILENIQVSVNDEEFICELFAMTNSTFVLDKRLTTFFVVDPMAISTSSSNRPAVHSPSSTPAESATTDRTTGGRTTEEFGGPSLNVAAVAGGVAGGAVFLIIIIVVIIFVCRLKAKNEVDGDGVVRRPNKKNVEEGSKKHRSGILSLRHKEPLFSTPYADDDDEEKAEHNAPVDTDIDTIIKEYRPKSKIASQLRVDLDVDGDEGTVENGFVPAQIVTANEEDESPYSMGIVEGRLGIMGPGTFAAAKTDPQKPVDSLNKNQNRDDDAENETAMNDQYTKVYKPNVPGDSSFDNMTYGPIEGVDESTKASLYDEEQTNSSQSQCGKDHDNNKANNASDVDTPNGEGDADRNGEGDGDMVAKNSKDMVANDSNDMDITEQNQNPDRESAAYAEIP